VRGRARLFLAAVPVACAAPPDAPAESVTHHRSEAGDANVAFTATVATLLHTDDDKGGRRAGSTRAFALSRLRRHFRRSLRKK